MRYIPKSNLDPLERARRRLASFTEHWQQEGFGLWAIILRPGGELIGQGGLNRIRETGEVEVDYILAKAYWGQGYATEVARASLWYGFEQIGLPQIIGLVVPENLASKHILEKIGMTFAKETYLWGLALYCYAIQRDAYFQLNGRQAKELSSFQIR